MNMINIVSMEGALITSTNDSNGKASTFLFLSLVFVLLLL